MRRRHLLWAALPLAAGAGTASVDHGAWTALLRRHVRLLRGGQASVLDYAGMAADRAALQAYLAKLSAVPQAAYAAWPRAERAALLINAYNAFTVELVLTRYPALASIKDLGSLLTSPWKRRWIPLLGATLSLDDIEHERLRPLLQDARVHFAVNCASVGCPMLREEAYTAERLEAQLDEQTQRFLRDRTRNRVEGGELQVSKIFDWYAGDFQPGVPAWLARHAAWLADDATAREAIAARQLPVRHLDYDWALNAAR